MDSKAKAQVILNFLLDEYERQSTFGAFNEVILQGDSFFTLKDWGLMFKSVPRLRAALAIGLVLKFISRLFWPLPNQSNPIGSIKYTPGKRYNFFHRCLFGDLLVLESYLISSQKLGLFDSNKAKFFEIAESCASLLSSEGRTVGPSGDEICKYSYYPQKNHLVPECHPMYKSFSRWDIAVPDNDSTAIAYACFRTLKRTLGLDIPALTEHDDNQERYLRHLREHLRHEGRSGKSYLSYHGGLLENDVAVLTWTMEEHNEIDPTVNLNVLSYLISLKIGNIDNSDIEYISNTILKFLFDLSQRGQLLDPRLQQYYPIGSAYYLWYRFLLYVELLSDSQLGEFDRHSYIPIINDYFKHKSDSVERLFSAAFNHFDRVMLSPFLLKNRIMPVDMWHSEIEPLSQDGFFRENFYHFCHIRYPSKVICTINLMPLCAVLYSYVEIEELNE